MKIEKAFQVYEIKRKRQPGLAILLKEGLTLMGVMLIIGVSFLGWMLGL